MTNLQRNKQIIADLLEVVWRQGKLDQLSDFWTNDCVNHADPSMKLGLDALRTYHAGFSPIMSALSNLEIAIERQIAEGDLVTSQIAMKAVHTGELFGMPATGKNVQLSTIRIDRIQNGKIAEHWSVADMMGFMQQLKA